MRVVWLFHNGLPLYSDEAQYWIWSQNLDFGYYSKPPMIAWLIRFSVDLFGDSEGAIRLLSPIIHLLTTYAVYVLGRNLYDARVGLYSALTYITLPAVFFSSMLISTDVPLLLIWALSLNVFYKALHSNRLIHWLAFGALFGLGMMTKYHFALFALAGCVFILYEHRMRGILTNYKVWLAAVLATLIFLPNILWNMNNHFVSFSHTADLATSGKAILNFGALFSFLGAQFGVFGPILCVALVWILHKRPVLFQKSDIYLLTFSALFIISISVVALLSKAYANWAAPAYIGAIIFIAAQLSMANKLAVLRWNFGFQFLIGILFLGYPLLMQHYDLPDPYKRLRGMKELGAELDALRYNLPDDIQFITDDRKTYASLVFYTKPHLFQLKKWNPQHKMQDHFDMKSGVDSVSRSSIFISAFMTEKHLSSYSSRIQLLKHMDNGYRIYLVDN